MKTCDVVSSAMVKIETPRSPITKERTTENATEANSIMVEDSASSQLFGSAGGVLDTPLVISSKRSMWRKSAHMKSSCWVDEVE